MSRFSTPQEMKARADMEAMRQERLLVDQAFAAFQEDGDEKFDTAPRIFAAGWFAHKYLDTQAERLGPAHGIKRPTCAWPVVRGPWDGRTYAHHGGESFVVYERAGATVTQHFYQLVGEGSNRQWQYVGKEPR